MKTRQLLMAVIGTIGLVTLVGPPTVQAQTPARMALVPLAGALSCPYPNRDSAASGPAMESRCLYAQEMDTRINTLQESLTKESQKADQALADAQDQWSRDLMYVHCQIQGLNDELSVLQGELAELKTGRAPASGDSKKIDAFGWGAAGGAAAAVILLAAAALSGPLLQALLKRWRGKPSQ